MKKLLLALICLGLFSCSYYEEEDIDIIIDSYNHTQKSDSTSTKQSNDKAQGIVGFGVSDVDEG